MSTEIMPTTETIPTPTTPGFDSERGMLVTLAVITVLSLVALFLAS